MVPTSYKLEGVVKEGDHPQRATLVTEIWKGKYNDKKVGLKILKVPQDYPHVKAVKSVSAPRDPPVGSTIRRCSDRGDSGSTRK